MVGGAGSPGSVTLELLREGQRIQIDIAAGENDAYAFSRNGDFVFPDRGVWNSY